MGQIDFLCRDSRRIVQRGEQDVLLHSACIRLDTLQNAGVKWMQKVAIAQQKADRFRAAAQYAARLRIRTETEPPNRLQHARPRLSADVRTGIQYARNRSDADACSLRHISNFVFRGTNS